ncbi:MFS transporter [Acinetobacter sp. SM34]|uniref:MFS transporter n=1 Tax=Acinetobacter sp. SM34 TaxID=1301620 RepID=UPI001EDA17F0|nr:MFS transporter [Acinetobacter sp. SM34]MCG2608395.1 MFS transporter [Acinetobacter sp. SM34]
MDKNNKIFIAASLANGANFSMILPLLAPLVRQLKLSELQGGAMVSGGALLMAIAAIYISKNQNKFSIYQLLSLGFIGMTITWGIFTAVLLYGLSVQVSLISLFGMLMAARVGTGVFMAMPKIALQTYVMTRYGEKQERSQTMSKFGALNSVGVIVGPFLTTLLLAWSILAPLWAAMIILSLISLVIVFGFERSSTVQSAKHEHTLNAVNTDTDFSIYQCSAWLLLGFSLYLAIVTVNLTAGFYIQDHFHMSIAQGAVYFSQCSLIVGIALVVMQSLISRYLQWSVYRLLWVGILSLTAALLISVLTEHIRIFQLVYILYGITVACLIPAFTTGAAKDAPKSMQAKVASWCTATQALSFVLGLILSTGLYQWHKTYPYYFLLLLMLGLMIYFSMIVIAQDKKKISLNRNDMADS